MAAQIQTIPVRDTALDGRENPVLDSLTRYNIQLLRTAGLTQAKVAALVGCCDRTVSRVEREAPVDPLNPPARLVGRPSKARSYIPFVVGELTNAPDLQTGELLHRARKQPVPYSGGKSAFYDMVRRVRRKHGPFVTRFEGLPGEFTQHDFGTVVVTFLDGSCRRIKFFASRLKYSRFAAISIVPDETAETLVRTLLEHFGDLGGIPTLAVFDRPRTVAVKWDRSGHITQWNSTFAAAAMDIGFTAEVCWAYAPNQKGSVENIVGWVKSSFFKQRKFQDFDDLLDQLEAWLEQTNLRRKSRATGEIPDARRQRELERLRPPRATPEDLAIRKPIRVGPTAVVTFEGHGYAVDPALRGRDATLFIHRDRVRIVSGQTEVSYPRKPEGRRVSTGPDQREAQLAQLTRRGRQYCRRQHLLDLGGAAEGFLTELVHRTPDWDPLVVRLHGLLDRHGDDAVERAMKAALDVGKVDVDHVARLLGEAA